MKFLNFFSLLWVLFALLDPDLDPDEQSQCGPTADPDPKHWTTPSGFSYTPKVFRLRENSHKTPQVAGRVVDPCVQTMLHG